MIFLAAGNTDVGLVRKENQDNFLILPKERLYAVADGMGGHAGGRQASAIAVEVLEVYLGGRKAIDRLAVEEALKLANARILQASRENKMSGMGTTVVLAYFEEAAGLWQIVHVGDSRAYAIDDVSIYPLTRDHSLVSELLAQGGITPEEAKKHPQRHILTRALGMPEGPGWEWSEVAAQKAPRLLLCTDGLYNMVEEEEIRRLACDRERSLKERTAALVEKAKQQGGRDNITLILIEEEGIA